VKEISVPVIFAVDEAGDVNHANRIVLNALEHGRARVAFTDDAVEFLGLDWRVAGGGVSMEGDGIVVAKVRTVAELMEAIDGLDTLVLEHFGEAGVQCHALLAGVLRKLAVLPEVDTTKGATS
jgi:hypothetical protein